MNAWNQIVGHDWAVSLLVAALKHGRLGHAYLFTGAEQIGKVTLARTFAQAVNCERDPEARPCGQCRSCTLIAADRHPDVRLVEPEISKRGRPTLKIDDIRDLQHELQRTSVEARYRVAILRRFDAATLGAANAFLKSLEEPPAQVILLLTAPDADTLLPTIVSRCRTLSLRVLDNAVVADALLHRWGASQDQAQLLAHLAEGRLGWAVDALAQPELLEAREQELETLAEALAGNRVKRFALADRLSRKPELLPHMLRTWLGWWRDLVRLLLSARSTSASLTLTNIDRRQEMERVAQRVAVNRGVAAFKQTDAAIWQLEHNANTRLVLENLFLTYPLDGYA